MKTLIGHSTFPKMTWKPGNNVLDFSTKVTLGHFDALQTNFIAPMTQGKTVELYIEADRMTGLLHGLLPVPYLRMHKVLKCHGTNITVKSKSPCRPWEAPTVASASTSPEMDELFQQLLGRRLQTTVGDQQHGYQMQCVVDKDNLDGPSVAV